MNSIRYKENININPIRSDGSNTFARHTMEVRVPAIIKEIVERNPQYPRNTQNELLFLKDSLQQDNKLSMLPYSVWDYHWWEHKYHEHSQESWLHTEWFFEETFVYRHILEIVRWWEIFSDPFLPHKKEELKGKGLWNLVQTGIKLSGPRMSI